MKKSFGWGGIRARCLSSRSKPIRSRFLGPEPLDVIVPAVLWRENGEGKVVGV